VRSRKLISVLGLGAALLGPLVAATPAKAAPVTACDDGCTGSFSVTGAPETFTVPGGVSSLAFSVRGAAGGTSLFGVPGGLGAEVTGSVPVTPGETLTVLVGQAGSDGGSPTFGGGGSAGRYLASGGGGSFLFAPDGTPLAAAGGGGGGAMPRESYPNYDGPSAYGGAGAGAGSTGGSGRDLGYYIGYVDDVEPSGGTPSSGGHGGSTYTSAGGDGTGPAADGAPGVGGNGDGGDEYYRGGGGGGGYFGGGGGGWGESGAGGSGYAAPTVTNLSSQDGVRSGDGVVSLGWSRSATLVAVTTSPDGGSRENNEVTITATGSGRGGTPTGTMTFLSDGAGIDGCADRPVVDGAATCTTTALAPATHALSATYSGDLASAPATSSTSDYVVYPPLQVTTTSLPSGTVGWPYSASLAATAGKAPYEWQVTAGSLPTGLTLSTGGTLSGTPTHAADSTDFTATATDSLGTPYTATGDLSVSVAKAATISGVRVTHATVSATVAASAPGGGSPGGTVSFAVAGTPVGTATVLNSVATLAYTVPSGRTQQVAATYSGDDDFLASSASTARQDPSIAATVTGAPARTRAGWYRGRVTVRFSCATAGAPLTTTCPKPVTLDREGARQTVTRTVLAADGGADTVTVNGIAIDHTAPSVRLSGARTGAVYRGTAPRARCTAGDRLAGVATCTLTQSATPIAAGRVVHYRVTATDRAGNRRAATGSYTVLTR